jgi:ATP-dependent exoDNAse (exonuclease V) alpha subunit
MYASWTPIEPVSLTIPQRSNGPLSVKREQFPVVVAEALTIHKSQGSTYTKAALEVLGKRQISRSLKYVACSRATSASGLFIVSNNFKA